MSTSAPGGRWARSGSGPLKNLGLKWRNAAVRSSHFGNDLDENRLILSYTLAL